jgi:hypothetical protein
MVSLPELDNVRDIGLKFDMVMVIEKLEDLIHGFLPGSVHK